MATVKLVYGTSTALTITLASLANATAQESASVDNESNQYLDYLVQGKFKLVTGTPSNQQLIYMFVAGSEDGTKWTDNATGSNAAVTLRSPTNLRTIDMVACPDTGGLTWTSNPVAISGLFGGVVPRKWNVIVYNATGLAFSATAGDHAVTYTPISQTIV